MKPRDVDFSPAMRRLSLFATCACCKTCKGFRPQMDGVSDDDVQQRGLFYFDISHLDEFDLFETCRDCQDSIKDHMDGLSKKMPEEIEYFGEMAKDASTVHKWLSDNEDRDRLAVLFQTYQIMMKSLSKCSLNHLPNYGEPPSEPMNAVTVLTNYICSLELDTEESQRLVSLAGSILSDFNAWTIPPPKDFAKAVPDYETGFYKVLYGRWLLLIEFPQQLKSMKQHEAPDIFGGRALHAFLNFYLATLPKNHDKDVASFAKDALAYCETSLKNAMRQRLTLPPDVEPIRYARSVERYEYANLMVKGKKRVREVDEIEPLKSKAMLQCIVRIVEHERQATVGSDADKIAIDVAKSEAVKKEVEAGVAEFRIVGCTSHPCQDKQEMAWLIQLKTLFCVQLPKMGNEYITRLVFDQNHKNLALIKNCKVIGGVCFRPFATQGFMEIVFLAVTGSDQIKGYGTILMNTLKDYAITQGCLNLMTYADSFALGYFGKQGFSEKFDIPKKTYQGFIKDYEGATLMACQLHPMVRYGEFYHYIKTVRDMHEALASFRCPDPDRQFGGLEHVFRKHHGKPLKLKYIPGLDNCPETEPIEKEDDLDIKIRQILKKLKDNQCSWPFLAPVSDEEVPEYYDFIKYPIDLQTMTERAKAKYYVHHRLFIADLCRMFANCYKFNGVDTEYYRCGYVMNELTFKLVSRYFPDSELVPHLPEVQPQIQRV